LLQSNFDDEILSDIQEGRDEEKVGLSFGPPIANRFSED